MELYSLGLPALHCSAEALWGGLRYFLLTSVLQIAVLTWTITKGQSPLSRRGAVRGRA